MEETFLTLALGFFPPEVLVPFAVVVFVPFAGAVFVVFAPAVLFAVVVLAVVF